MTTFLTALCALLLFFFPINLSHSTVAMVAGLIGGLYLILVVLTNLLLVPPLQRAEQQATPRVLELLRGDSFLRGIGACLLIFPVFSILLAVRALPSNWWEGSLLFSVWLVLFGIALDLLRLQRSRLLGYLNPEQVIQRATNSGRTDIAQGRDVELSRWLATLSEVSLRALRQSGVSTAEQAINGQTQLLRHFLTVHRRSLEAEQLEAPIHQRTDYVMGYGLEHLDTAFHQALSVHLFPICSHILTGLGNIVLAATEGDVNKAKLPLTRLGSLGMHALRQNEMDLAIKVNLVLMAVARRLVADGRSEQLREPLLTLVGQLELLAKESFRQDKKTEIKVLTAPFLQLKVLFSQESLKDRTDIKSALRAVDSVLADFQNLELVMNTMPTISTSDETENEAAEATKQEQVPLPQPPSSSSDEEKKDDDDAGQ